MNPQDPQQQNNQPQQQPVGSQYTSLNSPLNPTAPQVVEPSKKGHKKLALWLMIGPSALFVLTIALYAISNFAFASSEGDLYGEDSPIKTILNIFFFLGGIASFVTWLPGLIIGTVLLIKQSK